MFRYTGIKRIWNDIFFSRFQKHPCPNCGEILTLKKISEIVNWRSPRAKDFDFSSAGGEGYMMGNVKFIWDEFFCPRCGYQTSIKELHSLVRENKKSQRK